MRREEYFDDEEEAQRLTLEGMQAQIWTALPAIITEVNYSRYTVSAQPAIQGIIEGADGVPQYQNLPLLINVPICFPCGGNFNVTLPVQAGDECLIIFASRCIDAYWTSGGVQKPQEIRMHDLSDGLCILAPYSQKRAREAGAFASDAFVIRDDKNNNFIRLTKNGVLDILHASNLIINTQGNTTINVSGNVDLTANSTTITAPTNKINGTLTVSGLITGQGGLSISGGSGAQVTGTIHASDDITSGRISLQGHVHGGVQGGSGTTNAPQ